MITIQSSDLTENQLAEIALAIQNRWGVAAFVKMHEIAVVDDDEDFPLEGPGKDSDENFEKGFKIIMERLKMDGAFVLEKVGRSKFRLLLVDHESLPTWLEETAKPKKLPEGVYECPHCGKWFDAELLLSMHTKLHYIILQQ